MSARPHTHPGSCIHRRDPRGATARPHAPLVRPTAVLAATLAVVSAIGLAACGNTIQDQPIPHNTLESLELAPFPVYWLGKQFAGYQITEATRDPSGSFTVQYGDCLEGGQSTCVAPVKVITSPDNSFVPGEGGPTAGEGDPTAREGSPTAGVGSLTAGEGSLKAGEGDPTGHEGDPTAGGSPTAGEGAATARTSKTVRGLTGYIAERGRAIAIATGPVVLDIYAHTPALARAAAETAVPINFPAFPTSPLPQRLPNTGYNARPLPSQIPNQLRPLS